MCLSTSCFPFSCVVSSVSWVCSLQWHEARCFSVSQTVCGCAHTRYLRNMLTTRANGRIWTFEHRKQTQTTQRMYVLCCCSFVCFCFWCLCSIFWRFVFGGVAFVCVFVCCLFSQLRVVFMLCGVQVKRDNFSLKQQTNCTKLWQTHSKKNSLLLLSLSLFLFLALTLTRIHTHKHENKTASEKQTDKQSDKQTNKQNKKTRNRQTNQNQSLSLSLSLFLVLIPRSNNF